MIAKGSTRQCLAHTIRKTQYIVKAQSISGLQKKKSEHSVIQYSAFIIVNLVIQ